VPGSIGPGSGLPSLGHVTFRELRGAYYVPGRVARLLDPSRTAWNYQGR